MLTVGNLSVEYVGRKIIEDIGFELKDDETLAIIGPNGAGKTVLVKCLLGLVPFSGQVVWSKDARVGYVPQKLYVDRDLPITVGEFLSFKEKNRQKIESLLQKVGFESEKMPLESKLGVLSGGEFQRVLIAHALLGDPNVLIFDEPTSGVDIVGEETIYGLINKLKAEAHLAIIFISHELQIVNQYADTVLCLNKQKVCYGAPNKAVNHDTLSKLYGEDVSLYHHDH